MLSSMISEWKSDGVSTKRVQPGRCPRDSVNPPLLVEPPSICSNHPPGDPQSLFPAPHSCGGGIVAFQQQRERQGYLLCRLPENFNIYPLSSPRFSHFCPLPNI